MHRLLSCTMCVDILSRLLLIIMYMTTIHFCDCLYYQVIIPERTWHFHVHMPDAQCRCSKMGAIKISEAIHSWLGRTRLSLYPLFFKDVIDMLHEIVDLNSLGVGAGICVIFIYKV